MRKRLIFSLILLLTLPNLAFAWKDDWTKADTTREVAWQVLNAVDWAQTLEIARQPEKYHERNPILGKHPSVGEVNTYMGISAVAHVGISYLLPKKYRMYWQYITIGVSGTCMVSNFNIGLGVRF